MDFNEMGCIRLQDCIKKKEKKTSGNSNHPKTNQPDTVWMERNQRLRTENNVSIDYFEIGYRNDP